MKGREKGSIEDLSGVWFLYGTRSWWERARLVLDIGKPNSVVMVWRLR